VRIDPHDETYPPRLCDLDEPPPVTVSGPLVTNQRVVAIVGSRSARPEAIAFAFSLAYHLARAGVIVVSGGAKGVDRTAHLGAIQGGGATWCVACCGRSHVYPPENADLFSAIESSETSRMIWPFPDATVVDEKTPRKRNGVLVALAECLVVVQATHNSGSQNAATWAIELDRPRFVVPSMPWDKSFAGSITIGASGAQALWSIEWFFKKLGLAPPDIRDPEGAYCGIMPPSAPVRQRRRRKVRYSDGPLFAADPSTWTDDEKLVFSLLSRAPTQQEDILLKSGLKPSSAVTALLTLSLKDVVVEGPDGFFRRRPQL
jgi:DNA processing protein